MTQPSGQLYVEVTSVYTVLRSQINDDKNNIGASIITHVLYFKRISERPPNVPQDVGTDEFNESKLNIYQTIITINLTIFLSD